MTRTFKFVVEVVAPEGTTLEEAREVLTMLIGAGAEDAAASADLPEEDRDPLTDLAVEVEVTVTDLA